jgi:hypothetical protein
MLCKLQDRSRVLISANAAAMLISVSNRETHRVERSARTSHRRWDGYMRSKH